MGVTWPGGDVTARPSLAPAEPEAKTSSASERDPLAARWLGPGPRPPPAARRRVPGDLPAPLRAQRRGEEEAVLPARAGRGASGGEGEGEGMGEGGVPLAPPAPPPGPLLSLPSPSGVPERKGAPCAVANGVPLSLISSSPAGGRGPGRSVSLAQHPGGRGRRGVTLSIEVFLPRARELSWGGGVQDNVFLFPRLSCD